MSGLSVFSLDSPGGRERNEMMTKIVYNTRGTPACRVLAFVEGDRGRKSRCTRALHSCILQSGVNER